MRSMHGTGSMAAATTANTQLCTGDAADGPAAHLGARCAAPSSEWRCRAQSAAQTSRVLLPAQLGSPPTHRLHKLGWERLAGAVVPRKGGQHLGMVHKVLHGVRGDLHRIKGAPCPCKQHQGAAWHVAAALLVCLAQGCLVLEGQALRAVKLRSDGDPTCLVCWR
jgi:hypothetical protein